MAKVQFVRVGKYLLSSLTEMVLGDVAHIILQEMSLIGTLLLDVEQSNGHLV